MAAIYHIVLERMSINAFVSIVPVALLARILLVFPSSAYLFFFYCYKPP